MTTELTCSPSLDQSSALITRCHPMKQARCGPICANVDGTARRRKRSPGIRCRIENCVQSFTAVFDLARSRDRTFIAMVAEYCGHSLSIRTAEIADYCESDVRRLASKFPRRCSPAPTRWSNDSPPAGPMARRQIFRRLELAARHKLPAIYHYSKRRPIDGGELAAARPRGGGVDREREQRRHHLARDHRMTTDRLLWRLTITTVAPHCFVNINT